VYTNNVLLNQDTLIALHPGTYPGARWLVV